MGRKDEERHQRELEKRSQAFDSYYEAIYKDRWQTLKAALTKEKETVAFSTGLTKAYMLDEASIIAALALPVAPGDRVLDMCAAPGGKSLVILYRLSDGGLLIANDRSRERKIRLDRVLDEHLDQSRRALVQTSCRDASTWGLKEKEDVKTSVNDRCEKQFRCGLITINDWRAQIGESRFEEDIFDKTLFGMTDGERNRVKEVLSLNTKSGVEDGRKDQVPSVQDEGE